MSDMQLYLIALGAIFIAGVILFNWWQERRFSQDAIRRFDSPEDDALMGEMRPDTRYATDYAEAREPQFEPLTADREPEISEPTLGDIPLDETETPLESIPEDTLLSELPGATPLQETALEAEAEETSLPEVALDAPDEPLLELEESILPAETAQNELPDGMDEQIDLVGVVHLGTPKTGAELRAALQPLPGFEKTTQWFGHDDSGNWSALTREQEQAQFNRVACALQLADRSGAVSRECLRKFQLKVDALAEHLSAVIEWREHADPLKYAGTLDEFCIDVDVMVGFHIMHGANGPFAATKLRGIAEAGGMQLHEDGSFHYVTEDGDTLFTLVNFDHQPFTSESLRSTFVRGVSFQLDVPRVRNCPEAFNQMALLARKMESSLEGVLIDDNQQPLGAAAMDKIREQLRIIYAKMVARGIIPGSPTALRLFS